VGGKSFKSKKKKLGEGWGENKVPKKNLDREKKNWEGGGEKIKLQKKLRSGLRKGEKKSTWDGTGIEKRILSVHHPSKSLHWWVLVHSGPCNKCSSTCAASTHVCQIIN